MNNRKALNTILIIIVFAALSGWYVFSNHLDRHYASIEKVERDTGAIDAQIKEVGQYPDLPPLTDTWAEVELIASLYGVNVEPLKDEADIHLTKADLPGGTPWYGAIQGNVKSVAAAALEIQQRFPVIYGYAVIDNEVMGLSFAALGITDK